MAFPFGSKTFKSGITEVDSKEVQQARKKLPQWFSGQSRHRFYDSLRAIREGRVPVKVSAVKVEALEPRYLLSADIMPMADLDGDGAAWTLEFDNIAQTFRIYDDETGQLVDQKALSDVTDLQIIGTDGNDRDRKSVV